MQLQVEPTLLVGFCLVLVRATTWAMICPPFNAPSIPVRVRVGLSVALSFLLAERVGEQVGDMGTAALVGALFTQILASIQQAGFRKDAIVFVVSNPVDILTQLAQAKLGLPWQQVIGLGTMLDTARFRSLIAQDLKLTPTQVSALILGEHGDTMIPVWSSAAYAGLPLTKVAGCTAAFQNQIFERTKGSGAEVIRRKGGAGWAVGLTIAEVVHAIALNKRTVLPVSTLQQGAYGLRNVSISVPTVVGRAGALAHLEVELWPKELSGLQSSARALQETYAKVAKA